jgi:hypothetical protein
MAYTQEVGRRFWYELDRATLYNQAFFTDVIIPSGAPDVQTEYFEARREGTYPQRLLSFAAPRKADWQLIANVQTHAVQTYLGSNWDDVQGAFEDFGQGTLLDQAPERVARGDAVHMMDIGGTSPPIGYHRWHASIRAMQLLEIGDSDWWERLDRVLALAWAIQSFARPKRGSVANKALPAQDLQELRGPWLQLSAKQRDAQFDLAGEFGYHPRPKYPQT